MCLSLRYPVILSIENHCSVPQQKKMAQYLIEILGDKLDLSNIKADESGQLPSPETLKGKVLVKVKSEFGCFKSNSPWWEESVLRRLSQLPFWLSLNFIVQTSKAADSGLIEVIWLEGFDYDVFGRRDKTNLIVGRNNRLKLFMDCINWKLAHYLGTLISSLVSISMWSKSFESSTPKNKFFHRAVGADELRLFCRKMVI